MSFWSRFVKNSTQSNLYLGLSDFYLSGFPSSHSNHNRGLLQWKPKVLPVPVGQRSDWKIINPAAGSTLRNLLFPLAKFRGTWAVLRSDVDVRRGARCLNSGPYSGRSGEWKQQLSVSVQAWHLPLVMSCQAAYTAVQRLCESCNGICDCFW